MSLRHICLALHQRDVVHPIDNETRPTNGCRKGHIANLRAGGFFIKAESENYSASRLEFFLEQSFNGCTVLSSDPGATGEEKAAAAYSIPIKPLLSSELPLPQMNSPS